MNPLTIAELKRKNEEDWNKECEDRRRVLGESNQDNNGNSAPTVARSQAPTLEPDITLIRHDPTQPDPLSFPSVLKLTAKHTKLIPLNFFTDENLSDAPSNNCCDIPRYSRLPCIYPAFYKTNPFSDPVRYAWIGVSQLPFVFALSSKNNVLGYFLGSGYDKVHILHRVIGRVVVLAVNVHGLGFKGALFFQRSEQD
ncbi:hypothetical protein F5050DRAFT_1459985 [Lentinula boryana]|uniref:Ferric oxidoreductase domain-containing protein n=1 Tax=Lentinula boryana TaxID=40481 RepID=A0ABQ8QFA8_9AGAR|nr:hypothetical protein F5050DRAFT_1459985 [Lentinula boryana]